MHDPRSILVTLLGLGVFVLGVVRGSELLATGGLGTAVVGLLLPGLAEAAVGNFFSVKKKEAASAPDFGDLLTPDLEQSLGTAARRMLGDAGRARHSVETAVMRARSAWAGQPAEAVRPFLLCNLFHVMLAMPSADVDPAAETDLPDDPLLGRSVERALDRARAGGAGVVAPPLRGPGAARDRPDPRPISRHRRRGDRGRAPATRRPAGGGDPMTTPEERLRALDHSPSRAQSLPPIDRTTIFARARRQRACGWRPWQPAGP